MTELRDEERELARLRALIRETERRLLDLRKREAQQVTAVANARERKGELSA